MADKIEGYLEVGLNEQGEVVVNHPDLKPGENGVGHIVFSASQARDLADLLHKHANQSDLEIRRRRQDEAVKAAEAIPVDRSARMLTLRVGHARLSRNRARWPAKSVCSAPSRRASQGIRSSRAANLSS